MSLTRLQMTQMAYYVLTGYHYYWHKILYDVGKSDQKVMKVLHVIWLKWFMTCLREITVIGIWLYNMWAKVIKKSWKVW